MKVYIVIKLNPETERPTGMEIFKTEQAAALYSYSDECKGFWCNIVEKEVKG